MSRQEMPWLIWLKKQSMSLLSIQQCVCLFLTGVSFQSFKPPSSADVTCHCDCDCSAAARFEGLALLCAGLALGLAGPRLLVAVLRHLGRLLSQHVEASAALEERTPARRLAGVARPVA